MRIKYFLGTLVVLGIGSVSMLWLSARNPTAASKATPPKSETHTEWIVRSLHKMQTVKVGMTRADLLKVFTVEGGTFTVKQRTYVYRECPYIKVDVTFNIVGRPERDKDGRLTHTESPRDTIKTISRPYLAWGILN